MYTYLYIIKPAYGNLLYIVTIYLYLLSFEEHYVSFRANREDVIWLVSSFQRRKWRHKATLRDTGKSNKQACVLYVLMLNNPITTQEGFGFWFIFALLDCIGCPWFPDAPLGNTLI